MSVCPVSVGMLAWLSTTGKTLYSAAQNLGGLGIMLVAIADSSFLTLPEGNDVLIVMLSAGGPWGNMVFFVAVTILGSMLGCSLLYLVGRRGGNPVLRKRFSRANVERAERLFAHYGILTVVVPSILPPPCPFKIFVLSAGVFRLSYLKFILAVAVGRTARYSTWGVLAVLYGNAVKQYIQQNLRSVGIVLLALFIAAIASVLVTYLVRARRTGRGSTGA